MQGRPIGSQFHNVYRNGYKIPTPRSGPGEPTGNPDAFAQALPHWWVFCLASCSFWVAVKELRLRYHIPETILFTLYYGS